MKDDPLLNPDTYLEFETNMRRVITGICSDNQSTSTNCYKNSLYQARALRELGLLLADGTPTVGGGKTF